MSKSFAETLTEIFFSRFYLRGFLHTFSGRRIQSVQDTIRENLLRRLKCARDFPTSLGPTAS